MAGVIGGNRGIFVLAGTTLLLHGWVNNNDARIAIALGAPVSAITPALADRATSRGADAKIELRHESFHVPLPVTEAGPASGADMRIGQDILDSHPIEIDFQHHSVQPLLPGEARRAERRFSPIEVRRQPEGLSVAVSVDGGIPFWAALDLTSPTGVTAPSIKDQSKITIGSLVMRGLQPSTGSRPMVGLYAFSHMHAIFDLAHDRIWVRA